MPHAGLFGRSLRCDHSDSGGWSVLDGGFRTPGELARTRSSGPTTLDATILVTNIYIYAILLATGLPAAGLPGADRRWRACGARLFDARLDVGFPIEVRNDGSRSGTVKTEGFSGTTELFEREPSRGYQGEQRLLVPWIGHGKLVILRDRAVKVQLSFKRSTQLEPGCGWQVQAAGILELFVVTPSGFGILFLQMEL